MKSSHLNSFPITMELKPTSTSANNRLCFKRFITLHFKNFQAVSDERASEIAAHSFPRTHSSDTQVRHKAQQMQLTWICENVVWWKTLECRMLINLAFIFHTQRLNMKIPSMSRRSVEWDSLMFVRRCLHQPKWNEKPQNWKIWENLRFN